jgi:hypothetical protein
MASNSADVPLPEASQFPSYDDALRSFQKHGFLWQTIPGIEQRVASLSSDEGGAKDGFNKQFKEMVFSHEVSHNI